MLPLHGTIRHCVISWESSAFSSSRLTVKEDSPVVNAIEKKEGFQSLENKNLHHHVVNKMVTL